MAYTLAMHRRHLPHRASALLVENKIVNISHKKRESIGTPSIAMIFTGQGSQWQGMGKELMERSDSFRADIKEMDTILQGLKNPPSWILSGTSCSLLCQMRILQANRETRSTSQDSR